MSIVHGVTSDNLTLPIRVNSDGSLASVMQPGVTTITGGTDTRVLFNDGGKVGEDAGLTYNKTVPALKIGNSAGTAVLSVGSDSFQTLQVGGTSANSNGLFALRSTSFLVTRASGGFAWENGSNNPASGTVDLALGRSGAGALVFAPTLAGAVSGGVTSCTKIIKKVTGIADAVATDVLTVTVPNANHAAAIKLTILSSNGGADAFESSRVATGTVVLARTSGVATVAAVSTLEAAQIATVGGGATHTLTYGVSGMTGAAGATQTFTVQLTINDSGNVGSNQAVLLAELINSEATGVTIA